MIVELFIPVAADRYQLCKFIARTESVYGFMAVRGCVVILRCRTCIYHSDLDGLLSAAGLQPSAMVEWCVNSEWYGSTLLLMKPVQEK